ncbi:MAG: hypothetical protein A3G81_09590 [Betaproteobacteria bacterium RIFCSPLOWO2_12_FULL_65_14]|nr:MAG: hypothetical protein A3G81_09590 [Betaproteobacteria bacterium RIFCSPLOWO2_12_FULL_65_14]
MVIKISYETLFNMARASISTHRTIKELWHRRQPMDTLRLCGSFSMLAQIQPGETETARPRGIALRPRDTVKLLR